MPKILSFHYFCYRIILPILSFMSKIHIFQKLFFGVILGDYRLEKVPIPEPGLKEILVKVEAVGICASDAKVYLGAPKYWGKEGEKCRMVLPQIPGHEFSGKVVKLGPNAQDHHKVSIGDLVTAEQVVTCNDCRFCLKGDYNVCIKRKVFGFKGLHGAMAEYMIFPAHSRVYKIPEGMDPFHAAFVEPLSIAIHGINRAKIQFSDVVVISGCGPIGLGMISAAQRKSPKLIVALGNLNIPNYLHPNINYTTLGHCRFIRLEVRHCKTMWC